MTFLLTNWRIIAKCAVFGFVAVLVYWYGYHIPSKLKAVQIENMELAKQVEAGQKALDMLAEIQHAKNGIDRQTFKNISTIRSQIMPRNTVIVRGGVRP